MQRNVGLVDRVVRIALGIALLSAVVMFDGGFRWFGLLGIVPLLTGAIGLCPLYLLAGFSSCPLAAGEPKTGSKKLCCH